MTKHNSYEIHSLDVMIKPNSDWAEYISKGAMNIGKLLIAREILMANKAIQGVRINTFTVSFKHSVEVNRKKQNEVPISNTPVLPKRVRTKVRQTCH